MKLLLVLSLLAVTLPSSVWGRKNFVCYFPNFASERAFNWAFSVENINVNLCTHLVYSFASLNVTTLHIQPSNQDVDITQGFYTQFLALKERNPELVLMVAIGGWADSNDGDKYSRLVSSQENIDSFIQSVAQFFRRHNFDGLDVDWEFPTTAEDKAGLVSLLRSLRRRGDIVPSGKNFTLSVAVSADTTAIDNAYDVAGIAESVDFINLMAYDLHGAWEQRVDHHAPLMRRSFDENDLNGDYAVNYWIGQGMPADKINLGIPLYGRSWTLSTSDTSFLAPASGPGVAGPVLRVGGVLSYFEICLEILNMQWQVVPSLENGTYAVSPNSPYQWVSFDDFNRVVDKSNYVIQNGLGGAFVWDISQDDFRNACNGGRNPLITAIHNIVVPI